jgi:hypothetical protein
MKIECDCCDRELPARFWKIEKAVPWSYLPHPDPAALGIYCSRECAERVPTGSQRAAEARLNFILAINGFGPAACVWQRLLDAYPEPVPILNEGEVINFYRENGAPEDWIASSTK